MHLILFTNGEDGDLIVLYACLGEQTVKRVCYLDGLVAEKQ